MSYRRLYHLLIALFVVASSIASSGIPRQQQAPEPATTPPPQPSAGAANGPNPGQAGNSVNAEHTREVSPNVPTGEALRRDPLRVLLANGIGTPPDPAAVKRGQVLFVPSCGFCHGANASGGATGPDLVRSVLVLHDQGTGKEIGPVIHNGRPGKGMPNFNFSDAQIKDIAAFLLSRSQAASNRLDYKILNIVTGDPKAGELYFNGHCANCHSPSGDLAHIAGKFDPVALQSRFLYPGSQRVPNMSGPPSDPTGEKTVTVTLSSGQIYSGKLDDIDDFSVSLIESSGEYRSWLFDAEKGINVEVHDPLRMHADLLRQYTDADMHNILAYLETLK